MFIEKDGAFSELFFDHMTGKVATSDKITGGDDLKDAKAQSKAFAKAKSTLAAGGRKSARGERRVHRRRDNSGPRGRSPGEDITLMKGGQFKSVFQPLG